MPSHNSTDGQGELTVACGKSSHTFATITKFYLIFILVYTRFLYSFSECHE